MHAVSPLFVLHALPISSSLTRLFYLYLEKSTSYETPHYAVFQTYEIRQKNLPVHNYGTLRAGKRSRYSDQLQAGRSRGQSSSQGRVKNFLFSTSSQTSHPQSVRSVRPRRECFSWSLLMRLLRECLRFFVAFLSPSNSHVRQMNSLSVWSEVLTVVTCGMWRRVVQ
jgi:hypothetical protein